VFPNIGEIVYIMVKFVGGSKTWMEIKTVAEKNKQKRPPKKSENTVGKRRTAQEEYELFFLVTTKYVLRGIGVERTRKKGLEGGHISKQK